MKPFKLVLALVAALTFFGCNNNKTNDNRGDTTNYNNQSTMPSSTDTMHMNDTMHSDTTGMHK